MHLTRRTVLTLAIATGAVTALTTATPAAAVPRYQMHWRFCTKCYALFYNGPEGTGINHCAAGGPHTPAGYIFGLQTNAHAETPTLQAYWRRCRKCSVVFFWWYDPPWGHCPGYYPGQPNNGHEHIDLTTGYHNYSLAHDLPETIDQQANWRYCTKCRGLYYWGYHLSHGEGICPGGGAHSAAGFNFAITHLRAS